jgi:hypothetical protein
VSPYPRTVNHLRCNGGTDRPFVAPGSRGIGHIGSARDDVELELLKAAARQRLAAGQGEPSLGLEVAGLARRGAGGGPLPFTSSRMGHLLDSVERACQALGFQDATGGDEVFA